MKLAVSNQNSYNLMRWVDLALPLTEGHLCRNAEVTRPPVGCQAKTMPSDNLFLLAYLIENMGTLGGWFYRKSPKYGILYTEFRMQEIWQIEIIRARLPFDATADYQSLSIPTLAPWTTSLILYTYGL